MQVLEDFLEEDELWIIRVLLSKTHLSVRVGNGSSSEFAPTIGIPQGDSLSPVLFTIYLEAALRDVRKAAPPRPDKDDTLSFEVVYADDTDFPSTSCPSLALLEHVCCSTLAGWFPCFNPDKN